MQSGTDRPRSQRAGTAGELHRLNWALAAYARSITALINFANFDELVERVTEAIVGDDEYPLAIVGVAEDTPGRPIRLVAGAGRAFDYTREQVYSWSEDLQEGQRPAGQAIRSGLPVVIRDCQEDEAFSPWLSQALRFGIRSSATAPFGLDGRVLGMIKVYASEPDAFGPRELELFSKLGHELAFAMSVDEGRSRLHAAEEAKELAQEAGRKAQADLARAARLVSITEFASSIAHEVNQPVSAIIANTNAAMRWLNRPTPDLDEVRTALERIHNDANRTGAVIARARDQLTKTPPAREPVDVNQLLREAVTLTNGGTRRIGIEVKTQLDDSLPKVIADRTLLQQVAVNLISNALDAMRAVRERPRVLSLSSRRAGAGEIAVSIADTGIGLCTDGPQKVFEHFFTTKAEGLGLGLPISRSIIEGCGGRLTAEPNRPFGAVFTFTLPIPEPAA